MKLVCLGAKNPHTIRIVSDIKEVNKEFSLIGFIDNDPEKAGKEFLGYPIFGGTGKVGELSQEDDVYFCNIITGSTKSRYETTREMIAQGAKLTNIVHPSVNCNGVRLGIGNYIQEYVKFQEGVEIGDNSSIHVGSIIPHECRVGNSTFIAHGCVVSGEVEIGDGVFMGAGAIVLPRLKIGNWSVIGAGTVVLKNVPPYSVVVGNPGRVIKTLDIKYKDGEIF